MIRATLAITAALLLAACEVPREPEPYKTVAITPFLGEPVLGNPAAPVTVTEYASTTCGHCKAFHDEVFPDLKTKYIETGKVKLVWVVMPTPPAPVSIAGAALARCAGATSFFPVIDELFAQQDALVEASRNPWRLQKAFRDIGAKFSLSVDQVGTCMDDKGIDGVTRKGVKEAPAFITGTPTFLVDGKELDDKTTDGFFAAIDAALAKAPALTAPAPPSQ
ncbi:MAG: thioredoxin domain-containing protein [Hyphomonadaceae bacterium]